MEIFATVLDSLKVFKCAITFLSSKDSSYNLNLISWILMSSKIYQSKRFSY